MNSIKILGLFTLMAVGIACTSEPVTESSSDEVDISQVEITTYKNHGISFSIPKGWKHVESEIPESGMYIMVEKQGKDESGQFVVSILNNKVPLNAYMEVMKDELVKSLAAGGADISFEDIEKSAKDSTASLVSKFTHDGAGLDFQGELKTFHCGAKTIYVFVQEAVEDAVKNKAELEVLKSSLRCS